MDVEHNQVANLIYLTESNFLTDCTAYNPSRDITHYASRGDTFLSDLNDIAAGINDADITIVPYDNTIEYDYDRRFTGDISGTENGYKVIIEGNGRAISTFIDKAADKEYGTPEHYLEDVNLSNFWPQIKGYATATWAKFQAKQGFDIYRKIMPENPEPEWNEDIERLVTTIKTTITYKKK